jgi:hypothetical protein
VEMRNAVTERLVIHLARLERSIECVRDLGHLVQVRGPLGGFQVVDLGDA